MEEVQNPRFWSVHFLPPDHSWTGTPTLLIRFKGLRAEIARAHTRAGTPTVTVHYTGEIVNFTQQRPELTMQEMIPRAMAELVKLALLPISDPTFGHLGKVDG